MKTRIEAYDRLQRKFSFLIELNTMSNCKIEASAKTLLQYYSDDLVNVIYVPCHWFSCFCPFSKVTVNVRDVRVVRKLSPCNLSYCVCRLI